MRPASNNGMVVLQKKDEIYVSTYGDNSLLEESLELEGKSKGKWNTVDYYYLY